MKNKNKNRRIRWTDVQYVCILLRPNFGGNDLCFLWNENKIFTIAPADNGIFVYAYTKMFVIFGPMIVSLLFLFSDSSRHKKKEDPNKNCIEPISTV